MGKRKETIDNVISEYLNQCFQENVMEYYDAVENVLDGGLQNSSFQAVAKEYIYPLDLFFQKVAKQQESGQKGKIQYINLYFMNYEYQKGNLVLMMEAYSKDYLYDEKPISESYVLLETQKKLEAICRECEHEVSRKIVRLKPYELHTCTTFSAYFTIRYLQYAYASLTSIITRLRSFRKLDREDDFKLGFGEYGTVCLDLLQGKDIVWDILRKERDKDMSILDEVEEEETLVAEDAVLTAQKEDSNEVETVSVFMEQENQSSEETGQPVFPSDDEQKHRIRKRLSDVEESEKENPFEKKRSQRHANARKQVTTDDSECY